VAKYLDFKRATALGLGHRVSLETQNLRSARNLEGRGAFGPSPGYAYMFHKALDIEQKAKFEQKKLALNKTNKSLS